MQTLVGATGSVLSSVAGCLALPRYNVAARQAQHEQTNRRAANSGSRGTVQAGRM
jgi:hypothetical protein